MTVVEEGEAADLRTVSDALDKIDAFAGDIATVEESPSVAAHSEGELLVYAGHLYKVTAAIAIGDSLTLGTNVTPANVGTELSALRTDVDTLQDSVGQLLFAKEVNKSISGISMAKDTSTLIYNFVPMSQLVPLDGYTPVYITFGFISGMSSAYLTVHQRCGEGKYYLALTPGSVYTPTNLILNVLYVKNVGE